MNQDGLYRSHLATLDRILADALDRAGRKGLRLDAVLFHAGREWTYHRDDQPVPFRPAPHYLRWVPLDGPEHCVLARPGRKPLVVRVAPRDFWYEIAPPAPSYWQDAVDLAEVASFAEVARAVGPLGAAAYLGNSPEAAAELGIPPERVEPEALVGPLDWHRAVKTPHEVSRMEAAARRAADGHLAAWRAFESGASEREIHWAYLQATGHLEREVPFETIVAYDEKTSTLHYQNKRASIPTGKRTFMLDAGAACDGYASDITRSWAAKAADPVFHRLLAGLDELQRELVSMVVPARPFLDLHVECHRKVAALLSATGIAKAEEAEVFDRGVTRTFLPHGLGHHLGLQVHDVGGRQAGPDGGTNPPPPEYAFLRNTRVLEPGHVVTIEPGVYFIPMLLEALEASPEGRLVDWGLVKRLIPLGGLRIEDDVLCTPEGPRDLTRGLVPGPRGV